MNDEFYMNEALKEAKKAYKLQETPIGAVAVYEDQIIARAYNQREKKQNTLLHAEIQVIQKACKKLKSWRLEGVRIFVTLEPCVMCAGAMIQARVEEVIYGAENVRFGEHTGPVNLFSVEYHHKIKVTPNVLKEECSTLISDFFKEMRNK